jgi:hypothetical protein
VVRVVEQQLVPAGGVAVPADAVDELVVAPLVDDHEVGTVERYVEVERGEVVRHARAGQRRVGGVERPDRLLAVLGPQVLQLQASRGSYTFTSCPRSSSSATTPRRKWALPWFQSDSSE